MESLNISHHTQRLILKALNNSLNIKGASHQLKIPERTLYHKIKTQNIFFCTESREYKTKQKT